MEEHAGTSLDAGTLATARAARRGPSRKRRLAVCGWAYLGRVLEVSTQRRRTVGQYGHSRLHGHFIL